MDAQILLENTKKSVETKLYLTRFASQQVAHRCRPQCTKQNRLIETEMMPSSKYSHPLEFPLYPTSGTHVKSANKCWSLPEIQY